MTDTEIERLRQAVAAYRVCWIGIYVDTLERVLMVGAPPKPLPDEEPEPGECAYLTDGRYVALYNCELSEFVVTKPIP